MEFVCDMVRVLDWHAVVLEPLKEGVRDLLFVPFPGGECCAESIAVSVMLQMWRKGERVQCGGYVAGLVFCVRMLE